MTFLRAIFKIILITVMTILLVTLQSLYAFLQRLAGHKAVRQSPWVRLWYTGMTRIFGLHVRFHPVALQKNRQYLYISNHTSYLDIMVLGSLLPPYFVAKADTADWPIFGFLIKLGGTIFISRKRSQVRQQMALFQGHLQQGKHLLLFPEGTTSNGYDILPFKSSLLNTLYEPGMPDIQIVPVSIHYTAVNGHAFAQDKDSVSWYRDMELLPHLWDVLKLKSIAVTVRMHQPLNIADYSDAKKLTAQCETIIRQLFSVDSPAPLDNRAG